MRFGEIVHTRPVLLLGNGKSLQESSDADLQEAVKKCTVVAINGAGRIKPDIRFFLDGESQHDKSSDMLKIIERGKNGEKWAGRQEHWKNIELDYDYNDNDAPWNNTFMAALWCILKSSPDINVYLLGCDCNAEYVEHKTWSDDLSTPDGKVDMQRNSTEHVERLFASSFREVGEILHKYPGRTFSLCGNHGRLNVPEIQWSEIK